MFVIIVGGGKVGSYLTRALLNQGHEVVVVEKEERKAKMLERLIDRQVTVVGDGCDPLVLEQAGIARADVVVADTGDDEDNLVVVLIAKKKTKARCIARVNNPRNKMIFESLDPDDPVVLISSTEILLDVLNESVNAAQYKQMLASMKLFGKGELEVLRFALAADSPLVGKSLADVPLPAHSVVVAVDRPGGDLFVPTPTTVLAPGDGIVLVVKRHSVDAARALFAGPAAVSP
jgi:trk system potassium uptake protein TrkA